MARQFNGSTDKMQWDASASFIKQGVKYTMCAWVLADSTSAGSHGVICSGTSGGYGFQMRRTGSDWETFHKANSADVQAKDTGGVTAGVWVHLTGTWNGTSTTTIYRNGVSKGTGSATDGVANRFGVRTSIGYIYDGAGAFFNGRIADVATWYEVLTLPEIRQLAYGLKRPNEIRPEALIGYYPFDTISLWGRGRLITSPAVITGGGPTLITDPPLVAFRPTKLILPFMPRAGHRTHFNPIRSARRR